MTARLNALALAAFAALPLAACTAQTGETDPATAAASASAAASEVPAARVIGEPVRCIQTSRIRNTRVHSDEVIDFEMAGGPDYRVTLPHSCPGLGFEKRFAYKTSIGQLCSTDIITVLRTGGIHGPSCGLSEFVPIELVPEGETPASQPTP